ncbi:putative zinc-binding protein [Paucibacter sp. AS307]|uniref:putative zinc-binding protein n=1 Tax=Paucibacter soli TaxID=3133433 RepID=UPI00309A6459
MSAAPALPLVYSCSGCSDAAQLANHLALRLDRAGLAEMSCIAGVGGGVPNLVRKAREAAASGRPMLALDGCVLACTKACLAQQGLAPTHHIRLHEMGVRKHYRTDFDQALADQLFEQLSQTARDLQSERA